MKLQDLFEQQKVFHSAIKVPSNTTKLEYGGIIVKGNFDCAGTLISSLEGSPIEVDDFNCSSTKIRSLIGGPNKVHGEYRCAHTKIKTLQGAPQQIGGGFACSFIGLRQIEFIDVEGDEVDAHERVEAIINKHLKGDRNVHDAQEELIDAGLSEYAKI